jgi:hypothetical protein
MAKPGRPKFAITNEVIAKTESLAAAGLTKQEISDCLGISYQTLNEKTKEYSDFSEAITKGKAKGIAMMANNLVKLAQGGNAAANIFFLKARAKWREGDEDNSDILNKANEALQKMQELADKCLKTSTQS